ncbi:MAG: hypothetical protein J5959_12420 [Butyrivibrio sp.]|nr:hypothetical protein [Butyrivibrio sp.]
MKLYDKIIEETMETVKNTSLGRLKEYDPVTQVAWHDQGSSEFIMQRDTACEIGAAGMPSVNYTLVTTSKDITGDSIYVLGKDISEISKDTAFARIVILKTDDLGEDTDKEKTFQTIRNLEFVRYHVFPAGYMVRVSSRSNQEQVRISKEAVKKGISFANVGALYIKKYKELPEVKNVKILFITVKEVVEKLMPNADKVDGITRTLTHILDGMPTDCGHCSMKAVCDEVDGLREMHLGKK